VGFALALVVAGFFIFRTISLQPLLVQAKSDNSQLQTQLAQAKADSVKAQANANELTDAVSQLQSQKQQLQTDTTAAKASADKAAAQISALQAELKQAHNQTVMAKAEADKANGEVARLQARLSTPAPAPAPVVQAPPQQVAAAAAPAVVTRAKPMPINVSFRKAEVGDGNALLLQNTSDSTVTANVTFSNASATRSKVFHLTFDSGTVKELGSLGAWKLASGDRIQIDSTGFDSVVKTAP
jgi:hypothetical protein